VMESSPAAIIRMAEHNERVREYCRRLCTVCPAMGIPLSKRS
jgi:hypothetical protein